MVVESEVPELSVPAVFNKVHFSSEKYVKRTFSPPFVFDSLWRKRRKNKWELSSSCLGPGSRVSGQTGFLAGCPATRHNRLCKKVENSYLCTTDLNSLLDNVLDALQRQMGGGWTLEIVISSMPFHRVQKIIDFQGPTPSHLSNAQGCINQRCIGGFMYKSPWGRCQGQYWGGGGAGAWRNLIALLGPPPLLKNLLEIKRKV